MESVVIAANGQLLQEPETAPIPHTGEIEFYDWVPEERILLRYRAYMKNGWCEFILKDTGREWKSIWNAPPDSDALLHSSSQDMGNRCTSWGTVRYIRVSRDDELPMTWPEIWATFERVYPGQWAIQFFPPQVELVDSANIYHLFVLEGPPPEGFNILGMET